MRQSLLTEALLDPGARLPAGLVDPFGQAAPRRFAVYRNNVAASLTRALETGFPTLRKLVGDAFFAAMAGNFLRAHPPRSPVLMLYGEDFPDWLARFPPVAHLGYLPDVARLDQAMRESYHAADSTPLPEAEFQRLLGEDIARLRVTLAPSLRLIRSRWPIAAIWRANHEDGPPPRMEAESVVVLRPDFDPHPHALSTGSALVVQGLLAGMSLGESLDLPGEPIDLPGLLGLLIGNRAIVGVS